MSALAAACGSGVPRGSAASLEILEDIPTELVEAAAPEALVQPADVSPSLVDVLPTDTAAPTATTPPSPTSTPTETPEPTATPTSTPTAPPTETPSPTAPPTATYPPPPQAVHVPILMYHYISELPADADVYRRDLTVTPDRFATQLAHLRDQGYETVTLADIYATLTTGKPLPARPIVLTFDDGYKDAYTNALPLLNAYGFVGEFFVLATPAHYEAPQYMTWDEIRAMADAGMSLQAHGRDHYDLTNRPYDFLVYQILGAKEAVEAHTGRPVTFFCYPSGRHDADTEAVVESAGYLGAVTTAWGTELRLDNRYAWPRIRIKGAWGLAEFAGVLASLPQ
jgi:peptidoglycan/xylan/chitin deacetylase (PgdA/CDA1 family)